MNNRSYDRDELMTIVASRYIRNGEVCFVGIGLPSEAANLALRTHAPDAVLIYESGTIGARPDVLPLSIGDGDLARTADLVVSVPELFSYWLQAGRIDIGFLSAAQVDRFGNLNSTVIGSYSAPQVRLPGAGGAPEIASHSRKLVVIIRHRREAMVDAVDFVTSFGFGRGEGRNGHVGSGPQVVITDLCILTPDHRTNELVVRALHPGIEPAHVIHATGWLPKMDENVTATRPPTVEELTTLRSLKETTRGE